MKSLPNLRRVISLAGTVLVFAVVLGLLALQSSSPDARSAKADGAKEGDRRNWPLFGGSVSRDLVNLVEKDMPTKWEARRSKKAQNIKWFEKLGDKAYGGPIIAGGKIFIGTNNQAPRDKTVKGDKGIIMCFREATGEFLWQSVHDKLPAGLVNDWPLEGICSSPVIEGNRMWYVSNRCEVICADVDGLANGNQGVQDEKYKGEKDADILWRLNMIDELGVFPHNLATCSPLVVGDTLFVITSNGVDEGHINIPKPEAPSFLALNKNTGKVLWKDNSPTRNLVEAQKGGQQVNIEKLKDSGRLLMHGQWSNPVYAEPNGKPMIIFPGGDGWIRAFEPKTGELIWKFDCNPKDSVYVLGGEGTRNDFVSTPVIWENKLYIAVGQDPEHKKSVGHLWCIDITKEPKNKDKDLSPADKKFDPKAAVNKDSGLVWHYGGEAPPDAPRNYLFGRSLSTCSVHDGLCYAADFDGYFFCFDAKTGEKYWEDNLRADTWSSPYWVDGKVYIGNENGKMNIYAHGKTKKRVSQVTMDGKIRATPVAANGVLYVMTENPCRLWAISTKK
ncbi:MAG TPA: PQQ-binding-like beta-propeller repeat protein [Gemmataceae bacterium]|nr:PQQ-binding-like beta-propeller repeat protein [Gemmataceae bacterium]